MSVKIHVSATFKDTSTLSFATCSRGVPDTVLRTMTIHSQNRIGATGSFSGKEALDFPLASELCRVPFA